MNKYELWYQQLISKARDRNWSRKTAPCYVERHHITPKSLGGSDSDFNLVFLTLREHCVAHLLLCKFGDDVQRSKMTWAMQRFLTSSKSVSSTLYESVRQKWVDEHKRKLAGNTRRLGKPDSEETKLKKSHSMIGKVGKWYRTEEHRKFLSEAKSKRNLTGNNPMCSEEARKKVSLSKVGRKRIYREDGSFYMSKVIPS